MRKYAVRMWEYDLHTLSLATPITTRDNRAPVQRTGWSGDAAQPQAGKVSFGFCNGCHFNAGAALPGGGNIIAIQESLDGKAVEWMEKGYE